MPRILIAIVALALPTLAQSRGKVILISLDGFPAYALSDPKLPIPTLRKLISKGTSAAMTAINPTVT